MKICSLSAFVSGLLPDPDQDMTSPLRLLLVPAHVSMDMLRAQACFPAVGGESGPASDWVVQTQAGLHAGIRAV